MSKGILYIIAVIGIFSLHSCVRDDDTPPSGECDDVNATGITCGDATPYVFASPKGFSQIALPENNPLTEEGIYLGRLLFYDPILSLDSSQSCADCHHQDKAFTDPNKFSVGITGAVGRRNSMPLFNLLWHNEGFFWDGRAETLEEQVTLPVVDPIEMAHVTFCDAIEKLRESTMYREQFCKAFGDDEITQDRYEKALEQFLLTIISSNSKFDQIEFGQGGSYTFEELQGKGIFFNEPPEGGDCFHCHGNTTFSSFEFKNNGLDETFTDLGLYDFTGNERDKGKFKIPTLRNLAFTAPYMHDGRFETLKEVIDFYASGVHENSLNIDPVMKHNNTDFVLTLSEQEKGYLISYLMTLTDSTLTTNPAYSNPFK